MKVYLILFLFISSVCRAQEPINLADPTIFSHDGRYYLYGTVEKGSGNGFWVYHSDDLVNWKLSSQNEGYALRKGDAFGTAGFWAPQVFYYRDSFYMAYTANEQIAIARSNSPLGPFKQDVLQPLSAPTKQIDPFIYKGDDGKMYFYHVRLGGGNRIFVAQMKDDLSAIVPGTEKECIAATDNWENTKNVQWPVAEGPTVLKAGKTYYLFYSANDFRNPDYAVGYATARSPLGPWTKSEGNPIISRQLLEVNGPGHGDLFEADGKLWYVFHTHNSTDKTGPRKSALIEVKREGSKKSYRFVPLAKTFKYLFPAE